MNHSIKKQSFSKGISNSLIIIGLFFLGSSLAFIVAPLPLLAIFDIPMEAKSMIEFFQLENVQQNPYGRFILLYIQGFIALGGFVLSSYLYLRFFCNEKFSDLNTSGIHNSLTWLLVPVITLAVMPFTSWLIELNAQIELPYFLEAWKRWALTKEWQMKVMTEFLTSFGHIGEFLVGLIVIALIPAIGEELLFRGLIQRNFQSFLNMHIAVWLSAMIFSAIHLQFMGFIPRMVLGALFGYLYLWSGNLWTAVLAHFVNNGFTLLMLYLYNQSVINFNITKSGAMSFGWVLVSLLVTSISLYYFRQIQIKHDSKRSSQT